MDVQAVQNAHLELSRVDWELRQFALEHAEYQKRSNFPAFKSTAEFHYDPLQAWPTFVDRRKIESFAETACAVSRLLRTVLERVFDNDPMAIGKYFGIANLGTVRVMLNQPNGIAEALLRGDFMLTESGFKCLEMNVGANIDGWQTPLMAEMHLETPLTANFIAEKGLEVSHTDTLLILFKHILQETLKIYPDRGQPLNTAFGFRSEDRTDIVAALVPSFEAAYGKACEELDITTDSRLFITSPEKFVLQDDGSLKLGESRIHAVAAAYGANWPSIYRSYKSGLIKLFNSPACDLLSDKRVLAMLSMLAETDLVDAEEKKTIESAVPWTRTLDVPSSLKAVFQKVTREDLLARRENLVIKPAEGAGGSGVIIGRFASEAEWEKAAVQALESPGWVLQEFIDSMPLLFQEGEEGCSPHDVIWGPFVFGDTYGGMFLRVQPKSAQSVVNLSKAASYGMFFEIDE